MSRPNVAAPRNLSLTEELEKLEQSITLTLQGIAGLLRQLRKEPNCDVDLGQRSITTSAEPTA